MANSPTPDKKNVSATGAAGKADAKTGAYDPKPGAAVRGRRAQPGTTAQTAENQPSRKERRPDLIKQRREELRRMPDKKKKEQLYTRVGFAVLGVVIVALIAFTVKNQLDDRELNQIPTGTVTYEYKGGQHDDTFSAWPESPPVGGVHNNVWQTCGYYAAPIGKGNAVHSLEHGAVWITYRADVPQDQLDVLKKLAEDQSYILVSAYEDQASPIVATAWNHQIDLQSVPSKDLDSFIRVFKSNRTYTPEFGASCVGTNATM